MPDAAADPRPHRGRPHRRRRASSSTTRRSPRFLAERPADDRPALVERALRIGLLALQDAGVTVNVDVVRTEFEKLDPPGRAGQREGRRRRSSRRCARTSPTATAGCRGPSSGSSATAAPCAAMVDELFDETKRDSAIGRIGRMLERYFDGDASKLAHPARPDPAELADAPVPPGDDGGLQGRSRSASSRSRRPPRPVAPSVPGPRPRAATSRTCSRRCSATSPVAPATCSTGPGPRRARS